MRMTWVKYFAPFKRYAWLIIDDDGHHHWHKYKHEAEGHWNTILKH
jgi:hypothetical protein